jgi:2-polyprenyl-6-methoxyphenol hydroxylase-like FAD-dependent oxidoreductase
VKLSMRRSSARSKSRRKLKLEMSDVRWFSLYKVHSRRVNKFSEGRCFLAGDSAHIHSPAAQQGMNTGIGDA